MSMRQIIGVPFLIVNTVIRFFRLSVVEWFYASAMTHPGTRIRARRKELGLNQGELASLVGIAQGTLSDLERGDTRLPSAEVLLRMAKALQVSQAWIVTGREGEITTPTESEQALLESFRAMPEDQQKAVLALIESMRK